MFEQTQLAIESFDLTLVPGSVKKLMAGIKAVYEGQAKEEDKIKGAGGSSDLWKVPVNLPQSAHRTQQVGFRMSLMLTAPRHSTNQQLRH